MGELKTVEQLVAEMTFGRDILAIVFMTVMFLLYVWWFLMERAEHKLRMKKLKKATDYIKVDAVVSELERLFVPEHVYGWNIINNAVSRCIYLVRRMSGHWNEKDDEWEEKTRE